MYRLVIINKHNERKEFYFDNYEELEYNYSLCVFSRNIKDFVGQKHNAFIYWKTILKENGN